jgi:hypothetical protein
VKRRNGYWACSKDCSFCGGKGLVDVGFEDLFNHETGHSTRTIWEPCENAYFDYPDFEDERISREVLNE